MVGSETRGEHGAFLHTAEGEGSFRHELGGDDRVAFPFVRTALEFFT